MYFVCVAATVGVVDYTNYDDMKYAVGCHISSTLRFLVIKFLWNYSLSSIAVGEDLLIGRLGDMWFVPVLVGIYLSYHCNFAD